MTDVNIRKYTLGNPPVLHLKGRVTLYPQESEKSQTTSVHYSIGPNHTSEGLLSTYGSELFSDEQYNPIDPIEDVKITTENDNGTSTQVTDRIMYSRLLHLMLLTHKQMEELGVDKGYFRPGLADELHATGSNPPRIGVKLDYQKRPQLEGLI